jgi:hypothetical protein
MPTRKRLYRRDQLQPRPNRLFGVVLMGLGIAKIDEHTVAHIICHEAPEAVHRFGDAFLIGQNNLAQVLRIHARRECRRSNQVREHHRDLATLGGVLGGSRVRHKRSGCRLRARVGAQGGDGVQELSAMTDNSDTEVLQVLRRQAQQDRVVDCVLAECRLILFEAEAPQPTSKIHDIALTPRGRAMIIQAKHAVQWDYSRMSALGQKRK